MMGTFLAVPAISRYVGGGYSFGALPAALSANIFITGLNQMADIQVDKLNKPNLPLASGAMTVTEARNVVAVAGAVALASSSLSPFLSLTCTSSMALGALLPGLRRLDLSSLQLGAVPEAVPGAVPEGHHLRCPRCRSAAGSQAYGAASPPVSPLRSTLRPAPSARASASARARARARARPAPPWARRRCWRGHGRRRGDTPLWATAPSVSERRRITSAHEGPL